MRQNPPTRKLRQRPDLDQLKRQAKELLHAFLAGDADVTAEVRAHYRGADARRGIHPHRDATTALTLAIERGYEEIVAIIQEEEQRRREAMSVSAAKVTSSQDELSDAIARGDEARALAMLEADPSLVPAASDIPFYVTFPCLKPAPHRVRNAFSRARA